MQKRIYISIQVAYLNPSLAWLLSYKVVWPQQGFWPPVEFYWTAVTLFSHLHPEGQCPFFCLQWFNTAYNKTAQFHDSPPYICMRSQKHPLIEQEWDACSSDVSCGLI